MRFQAHLLASAVAGLALHRRDLRKAALLTAAGVLIDVDHLVLYALRSGDWNPLGALRYARYRGRRPRPGDSRPRYGPLRSAAHAPLLTLPLAWLAAHCWPALRPVAQGLTLHLAMDSDLLLHLDWRIWRRAGGRCERCGEPGRRLHIRHLRAAGQFWSASNRTAWCAPCLRHGWEE